MKTWNNAFPFAKFRPRPSEAGLSKLYNHDGTATANRQSNRKQTFRLCRKLKFSIEGVLYIGLFYEHWWFTVMN